MKNYLFTINNVTINLKAKHNREAMKLAGTFAIKEDGGIKRLIREDGKVVI